MRSPEDEPGAQVTDAGAAQESGAGAGATPVGAIEPRKALAQARRGDEVTKPRRAGSVLDDLREVLWLGWPNSVNMFMEFAPGFAMLAYLGDDAEHLAGAGMGFMFANVTGMSFVIGFGAGAQPLISQAFGAGNWARCGDLLQRQLAIHLLVVVAIAAVWCQAEAILLAAKQPPPIARLTAEFVLWRAPALPFLVVKEDLKVYLQAQNLMLTPMATSIVGNLFAIAGFGPLVARFGFAGAPLSLTLGNALQAALFCCVAKRALPQVGAWPAWSCRTALSGWGEILRMSIPAGALILCEWWGWEVNLFFAGLLCEGRGKCVELDVFPIVSNTMVVGFMVHYGFCIAAGTRVGNALGAGDHVTAQRTASLTLVLAGSVAGAVAAVVVALRGRWSLAFTSDPEVASSTAEVLPVVAAYIFLDALGPGALVALLRSIGVVRLPALLNFVAFYVIGIPFGLWLTFGQGHESFGVVGLWAGLDVGMLTMVVGLLAFLFCRVDWPAVALEARSRSEVQACLELGRNAQEAESPSCQEAEAGDDRRPRGKAPRKKKAAAYAHVAAEEGSAAQSPPSGWQRMRVRAAQGLRPCEEGAHLAAVPGVPADSPAGAAAGW